MVVCVVAGNNPSAGVKNHGWILGPLLAHPVNGLFKGSIKLVPDRSLPPGASAVNAAQINHNFLLLVEKAL